jgi:hypothetical protein
MQAGFDSTERCARDLPDFLEGAAFCVVEHHDDPLLLIEVAQRIAELT